TATVCERFRVEKKGRAVLAAAPRMGHEYHAIGRADRGVPVHVSARVRSAKPRRRGGTGPLDRRARIFRGRRATTYAPSGHRIAAPDPASATQRRRADGDRAAATGVD